jgi:hypothetical protein
MICSPSIHKRLVVLVELVGSEEKFKGKRHFRYSGLFVKKKREEEKKDRTVDLGSGGFLMLIYHPVGGKPAAKCTHSSTELIPTSAGTSSKISKNSYHQNSAKPKLQLRMWP